MASFQNDCNCAGKIICRKWTKDSTLMGICHVSAISALATPTRRAPAWVLQNAH